MKSALSFAELFEDIVPMIFGDVKLSFGDTHFETANERWLSITIQQGVTSLILNFSML